MAALVEGEVRELRGEGAAQWELVVGTRFLLAAGPAAQPARPRLLDVVSDDALQLETLIARLPLGDDGLSSFALAWWPTADDPLTVVVRGAGAADLVTTAGPRRLEAHGVRPWHLAEFRGVDLVRLGGARTSCLEWRARPAPAAPASPEASAQSGASTQPMVATAPEAFAPRFRIAGGPPREVTGAVLIGRRPTPPRIERGPVELVELGGGDPTVSATHLELHRQGGQLVATDLRSTNGTVVRTAGGSRRMRSAESIVVAPGAVLVLGGDTIVEILPPRMDPAHPGRQVSA